MTDRDVDADMVAAKEWWAFRQLSTLYGYSIEETTLCYLRFLNQNRVVKHYHMDRVADVLPTPTIANLESSPDLVDMEQEMKDCTG